MIWLRRILTVPLIVIFVVVFIGLLLLTHLSASAGNPAFYNDQLEKAEVYNWVHARLLPSVLDEIEEDNPDLPIGVYAKDDILSAIEKTLPPEWLQEHVESVNNAIIPYLVGDEDEFAIVIPLKDRVERGSQVIKEDLLVGEGASNLYNDIVSYLADQIMENAEDLPYDLDPTRESVENALRMVFSQEWVTTQLRNAIDSLTPYLTRDTDDLLIVVQIADLVDPAADATLQLLQLYSDTVYDHLLDEIITPTIEDSFGPYVDLPFEVSLSQEEIVAAVKQVMPQTWIYDRLEEVIEAIADYVKGETDRMDIAIDLGDRKAAAMDILAAQADDRLRAIFDSLPECSLSEFSAIIATLPPDTLPDCRPEGQSYDYFKAALGIDVSGAVNELIGNQIPDFWVYTDEQLRESIGPDNSVFIDDARGWVISGWTFSDADLRSRLDADDEQSLDDARTWIRDGYSFTQVDLRDWLADEAEMNLQDFDDARNWVHTVRTWLWALWLIPVLLLVSIGLLGGRNWRSRLAWPLVVLLVTCLGVYVALSVTQAQVVDPRAADFIDDPTQFQGVEQVTLEMGNELAYSTISSFISGIERTALFLMIGSGILIIALIISAVVGPKKRPPDQERPDTPSTTRPDTKMEGTGTLEA
jgi:hypothetical protein